MKILNRNTITKIFLFVVLIISLFTSAKYFLELYLKENLTTKGQKSQASIDDIKSFATHLDHYWRNGDIDDAYLNGKFSCPEYLSSSNRQVINKKNLPYDSNFLECNPLYMLCRFKKLKTYRKVNIEFLSYKVYDRAQFAMKFLFNNQELELKFLNSCRSRFLPQKLYSSGPKNGKEFIWDNFSEKVYIDKNYFSNLDFVLVNKGKLENIERPYLPLLNIKKSKMKELCLSLGGQLLEARYFDAAVNFQARMRNKVITKFPYPWSKKRTLGEHELGGENKKLCLKNYTRECLDEPFIFYKDYSPSWMGIYNSLGSYMEVFENKVESAADLKVSSYHIERRNFWNQNFLKSSLLPISKVEADIKKFNGITERDLETLKNIKIKDWGFRCMFLR